jgi:hypothetical protein
MGMLGLVLALGAVAIAQWWHGGSLLTLLDGPAFVIVVGGTWGGDLADSPQVPAQCPEAGYLDAVSARWILRSRPSA